MSKNKIAVLKLVKNNSGSFRDSAMNDFIATVTDPEEKLALIKLYHEEVERVMRNKPKVYVTCRPRREKGSTSLSFIYTSLLVGIAAIASTVYLVK